MNRPISSALPVSTLSYLANDLTVLSRLQWSCLPIVELCYECMQLRIDSIALLSHSFTRSKVYIRQIDAAKDDDKTEHEIEDEVGTLSKESIYTG